MSEFRWLAIPALVGLVVLVAMATTTETRDEALETDQFDSPLDGDGDPLNPQDVEDLLDDVDFDDSFFDAPAGDAPSQPVELAPDGDGGGLGGLPGPFGQPAGGPPIDIDVRNADGDGIGFDLSGDDPVAYPLVDGSYGDPVTLDSEALVPGEGVQLTPEGDLASTTDRPSDSSEVVVRPTPEGLDVIQADGDVIEIRPAPPSDENPSGFTVTAAGPDGTDTELVPSEQGVVDIGEDMTVELPPPPRSVWEVATRTPWRWIVLGYSLLALASIATAIYLHLTRPRVEGWPDEELSDALPVGATFAELLDWLSAEPDPARAIRLVFSVAETGMGRLPARARTETPFEWHDRVAETWPDLAEPLGSLCNRYATARFAPNRPTRDDQLAAIDELHILAALTDSHVGADGATSAPGAATFGGVS
ncbi:MAG: DUF4129 domain-containing protein [Actinomycetota bacterium]